jgi:hypothetical protein
MKAWQKKTVTVACSGAILMAAWLGADPVQAKVIQTQTFASVVLLQPQHNISYSIQFVDGFQAKVTNSVTKTTSTFDVSANKANYLRQGIYQGNGKLLKKTNGFSEKLVELVPYLDTNGNMRWKGQQTLWGISGEDRIAVATSVWNIVNEKPQLLSLTVQKGDWDNMPSPDVEINSGFSMGKDITYVLDTKYADVTGDGVKDHVLLVGDKMGNAMNLLAENLRIVVREGKTKQQTFTSVGKWDSGYLPKLSIGRANQDQIKDVLVTMPNTTGYYYSQFTWKNNRPVSVIDQAQLNDRRLYQPVMGTLGETVGMIKTKQ